ncbi:MAG: hypothetical protein KDJ55_08820 [Rhodobiaceae bacterium]|nr:hypothetical protein [Rhodobiaceae bacterium]MCC0012738.1 hypothetical protein [Rhodobiaceae bacterium]MCC0018377.1 hypothetical protein [Rhodobiaceae bacterium]MCC0051170.1 hypothetical protein [Rhodobiaceae bacterium]MCC0060235.1 hypothetical protein [Rhodobiaceae bacterium]
MGWIFSLVEQAFATAQGINGNKIISLCNFISMPFEDALQSRLTDTAAPPTGLIMIAPSVEVGARPAK